MAVPYTFSTASVSIPLSQLDSNFASTITLGNTAIQLGNTVTTLYNMTLVNVAVTSGNVSANLTGSTVDSINPVGFLNIPQNPQTGNYTIVASDSGKHIFHASGAAAATYTIPSNATVSFVTGTAISFINLSANPANIAITTDTLYLAGTGSTGTRTLTQYGTATAVKVANTTWIISGTNLS